MMKPILSMAAVIALSASMSVGCGKKDETKGGKDKAATAAGADLADDAKVCCEFGAAVGSSTKASCLKAKGKLRPDLELPKCAKK